MPKAIWNEEILVESDQTVTIDGDVYFPMSLVNQGYLKKSSSTSICPRKGKALFFDVVVGDKLNRDAAWYYPNPDESFLELQNRIAFWKGIDIKP